MFLKAILLMKKKILGFLLKLYCEQDSLTDLNYIVKPEEYLIRIMFPDEWNINFQEFSKIKRGDLSPLTHIRRHWLLCWPVFVDKEISVHLLSLEWFCKKKNSLFTWKCMMIS